MARVILHKDPFPFKTEVLWLELERHEQIGWRFKNLSIGKPKRYKHLSIENLPLCWISFWQNHFPDTWFAETKQILIVCLKRGYRLCLWSTYFVCYSASLFESEFEDAVIYILRNLETDESPIGSEGILFLCSWMRESLGSETNWYELNSYQGDFRIKGAKFRDKMGGK